MNSPLSQPGFLEPDGRAASVDAAHFVILPAGLEATTSYGHGCAYGPEAILAASEQLELFDEELRSEPFAAGVFTAPPLHFQNVTPDAAQTILYQAARPWFGAGKCLISLGGEHAVSAGLVRAARDSYSDVSVLQFDAHSDLRDSYEGSKFSHASVMRRIHDMGVPFMSVGIRSFSRAEYEFMAEHAIKPVTPHDVAENLQAVIERLLSQLTDKVYITFDIDAIDPAAAPGTGTPEPGGLHYPDVLEILRAVCREKQLIGADIVEVMPIPGQNVTEFLAARLVYKLIGYSHTR